MIVAVNKMDDKAVQAGALRRGREGGGVVPEEDNVEKVRFVPISGCFPQPPVRGLLLGARPRTSCCSVSEAARRAAGASPGGEILAGTASFCPRQVPGLVAMAAGLGSPRRGAGTCG